MKRVVLFITILSLAAACRSKRQVVEGSPFLTGFKSIKWGAPASAVDSLVSKDTTWKRISGIPNLETQGKIIVVKDTTREYYLEFDAKDRFFLMNYISGKNDLDTLRSRLKRYYGEPDRLEKTNINYENYAWDIEADLFHLEIQILVTHKQYALKVMNRK